MAKSQSKKNIVGWSITEVTQTQIKKLAVHFRDKKVKALRKVLDILFEELIESDDFKKFVEIYDSLMDRELDEGKAIYSSYDISLTYMRKFKNVMTRFNFDDRSAFLRLVVDYVFQRLFALHDQLPEIKKQIEAKGYVVKHITPALLGDIFIQVENPTL